MRNFTREGAAVPNGHTQRFEYPYPRRTPARRGGTASGAVVPGRALPGGGYSLQGAGYRRAARGAAGGYPYNAAAAGARRRDYRATRAGGGYRGEQGAFRGKRGGLPALPGAAALPGRGATLCRGVYRARLSYTGRAQATPTGVLPGGYRPGEEHCLSGGL